jgi:predicted GIY-YIG superfamily endonuclease
MPRYRVYVIELDRAVMQIRAFRERNPDARVDKPCVYVGSTWLEPQKRFEQHKAGVKANRYARKFGMKLRERLMKHLQSYETRALAMAAEKRCAERLRRRGYGVWWG